MLSCHAYCAPISLPPMSRGVPKWAMAMRCGLCSSGSPRRSPVRSSNVALCWLHVRASKLTFQLFLSHQVFSCLPPLTSHIHPFVMPPPPPLPQHCTELSPASGLEILRSIINGTASFHLNQLTYSAFLLHLLSPLHLLSTLPTSHSPLRFPVSSLPVCLSCLWELLS